MNPANIIQCLSELFVVNSSLNKTEISQKARLIAQRLASIINSAMDCDQFRYEDEVTLDLENHTDDYHDEDNIIYSNNHGSDADDEWDDEENKKEGLQLNNYSIELMKEVVSFADAKDSSGKSHQSWNTIKHRYRSIPDQNYASCFLQIFKSTKYKTTEDSKY